tara:strand:+ start:1049 stop:1645 length:597 start_codon:yes stop_codon:yes gene_type:complete
MNEKLIQGYQDYYIATSGGDIYSTKWKKAKKLKPQKASQSAKGYYQVRLFSKQYKKGRLQYVHRLIYETFVGDIPEGYEIDHKDGDTTNNDISNLQIIKPRDNKLKYYKGKDIHWRQYRDEFIQKYEELGTMQKVAKHYGIALTAVHRVIKDTMHKWNYKTKKFQTVRFSDIDDEYTRDDRRGSKYHLKRKIKKNELV